MLRGNAICLIDEATKAVLRVSSKPLTAPAGCFTCSVRADQLPLEVQELSDTPVPFDIEAVFLGGGQAAFLADDRTAIRIEVRKSTDGEAKARHAEILARRFEAMEPSGLLETAILGLVRLAGADAVARAALGVPEPVPRTLAVPTEPTPKPERKTRKKVK